MKERVTITLEPDLLAAVDKHIDNTTVKNRSHAVELLLRRAVGVRCPRKALILAGGVGSRLRPITHEIPKPLIPLQDKSILEHLLDLFKKYDIRDIILSVGYKKEKIKKYFEDGDRLGVRITYIEEDEPLGTAGPILKAREQITEPIIVTNGDELKDINLEEMYELHRKEKALATIALTTVPDPTAYGVAELSGNRIIRFLEKPQNPPTNLISSGLYILDPSILSLIKDGFCMLEKDVFPVIAAQQKLFGYPFSGQWFDTGTIERYEKALMQWKGVSKER